ncbi:MAG: hypothetical protein F4X84_06705 [Synechococcus sp. SB0662_bin_45]|nr:hypothetical protein [Synechococcus sp. SB0668_bin_13]MYE22029.1 hypothetical protein [Synechococcus sp. SB0662_bin_45]MYG64849.1 hypothetical protein [Synechococcus sp. SB0675_bin_7]MYK85083.1 hypothetical protein [Synechococcus sp. SB0669_bin_7]
MSIPANATEAPSITKVWRQVKGNADTFTSVWVLILITGLLHATLSELHLVDFFGFPTLEENINKVEISDLPNLIGTIGIGTIRLLPTTIISSLAEVLITAVPAIYYATNRCPQSNEIFDILIRKPLRYVLAGMLFAIALFIGFLLCIIPGILVALAEPLYVYYIFTTDLNLMTCVSKSFKGMFRNFGSFLIVSLLSILAIIFSLVLFATLFMIAGLGLMNIFPPLVIVLFILIISVVVTIATSAMVLMRELYMQNYIHHKGLVRARELV